jgi:hypothetical protein
MPDYGWRRRAWPRRVDCEKWGIESGGNFPDAGRSECLREQSDRDVCATDPSIQAVGKTSQKLPMKLLQGLSW